MFTSITISHDWQTAAIALISTVIATIIVAVAPSVPRLYGHCSISKSVQATHSRPTPRVGGAAIFGAIIISTAFAPPVLANGYAGFISAAGLLFVVGLMEDLGFGVSPARRLLSAMASSLVVVALLGMWLPRLGIPGADVLMDHALIGVPMTLILTAGITNGFNLIDGVNGMAAVAAMGTAVAFGSIASAAGNQELLDLNTMLVAAIFGFFILNFPFGLVFLGDAGAYTLGFILAWFGIAILIDIPDASPWAVLLCLFWPIADMLLAIFRRMARKVALTAPDRLHVHQLVMRSLEICVLGRGNRRVANPLTTVVLSPFVLSPPAVGVLLWNQNGAAFLATLCFAIVFSLSYAAAPRIVRRLRMKRDSLRDPSRGRDFPTGVTPVQVGSAQGK